LREAYQYREVVAGCVTAGVATVGTPAVGAVVAVEAPAGGDVVEGTEATYSVDG
jgi:glycine cleavage system H lipoate-binding protein